MTLPIRLGLQHIHSDQIGYGALGVSLERGLQAIGVDVVNPQLTVEDFDAGMLPKSRTILWVTVPSHVRGYWSGSSVNVFSMWEATRLPESFTEAFDNIDTLIVPNAYNLEQFSEYHPNVKMVPLGIETDVWVPKPRVPGAFMDFLICGAGVRKGTDLAYKAFFDAFPKPAEMDPVPRLVMKNHREDFTGEFVWRIGQRLATPDLVGLYHSAHVYVQPSRGEGWGYQPHQALATGMPAIMSDIPGHRDYAEDHPGAIMVPTAMAPSAYFIYGDAGEWWEPDYDALVDAYRMAYDNWDYFHTQAQMAAPTFARRFSEEAMARGVVDALGGEAELSKPYDGSGEWITAELRKFLVICNRDWKAEIAGNSYIFRAGVRYWELADVKRILFEAGILDPACLDDDAIGPDGEPWGKGLTDDQVAQIGEYSARFERCPRCGRTCGCSVD